MHFFIKCRDKRLYSRQARPLGTEGILFYLPCRLVDPIRTVGVDDILQGTEFPVAQSSALLSSIGVVDLSRTPGFVWYNWDADTVEPFPEGLSPSTVEPVAVPAIPVPASALEPAADAKKSGLA